MNTQDIDIELPPLPEPDAEFGTHSRRQIREYTRAAIEADRKRRGEPVARDAHADWVQGPYVTDTMASGWCVRIDGTSVFDGINQYGTKGRITFEIAGGLKSKEEAQEVLRRWCLDALSQPAEPRSGEPVAFAKDGNLFWHGDHRAWREFSGELYLAPQPAQRDPTLPYEQALSELIDKIIPGLDSGDILADAKTASAAVTPAEPVKVPSDELLIAATSCPHDIDRDRVILKFDSRQEGHNALNQLSRRLDAVVRRHGRPVQPAATHEHATQACNLSPDRRHSE